MLLRCLPLIDRYQLMTLVREGLDADEKRFLLSLKEGEPDWGALGGEIGTEK